MTVSIHPLARVELADIALPRPISHYRPGITERLYTNPFGDDFREYPCPLPEHLQQKYAEIVNIANRVKPYDNKEIGLLTRDNILFTAGSIMGIDLLIRAFCSPGKDGICISTPTFNGYMQYAHVNLVKVTDVPLLGENFDVIDVIKILSTLSKIIFLCVPNNPIGTCISKSSILEILNKATGLVVIDEAYIELADFPSSTSLIKSYPNLVVLRTFSKAWGMAGIRAGAVIAAPEIIATLQRIQYPFSMSTPVQLALKNAFANLVKFETGVAKIKTSRTLLQERLKGYSFIERVYPSNTNFISAKLRQTTDILDDIDNSKYLIERVSIDMAFFVKISIGSDVEQEELFNFLDRH